MARDDVVDPTVRQKCNVLFRQWAVAYKSTPGLESIARLYKELPNTTRRAAPSQSKVLRETEAEAHDHSEPVHPPSGHSRSSSSVSASASTAPSRPVSLSTTPHLSFATKSSKSKKDKNVKPFSLEKEKPSIMQTIASASVASTNLLNGLQLINRENERVSENAEVANRFETCKVLRRQVLRYIQLVENNELIGSLLNANDELVKALTAYEILDKSLSDDSDSDAWEQPPGKSAAHTGTEQQLAGLDLGEAPPPKPPRPGNLAMPVPPAFPSSSKPQEPSDSEEEEEDEDENDPFGDANAVKTPYMERPGMTWKQV